MNSGSIALSENFTSISPRTHGALIAAPVFAQPKIVAYVPNWIDLKSFSKTIDYAKITHINLAFENPTNDDGDLSFNEQNDLLIEAARTNHVKILMSIGGGSASTDKTLLRRYALLMSDARRPAFVASLARYITQHHLDGLDVDLEGPAITHDYEPFIHDLSKALKPAGKLLTAALSQGYGGKNVPDSVFEHLDFVNIMAYDATGYWDPKSPGQHSSFDFARSTVAYWLGRGLTKPKAVLGVPFYGYGFNDAFRKRDYPYAAILAAFPGAQNTDMAGDTIWYNGIPTIKAKSQYVLDEQLGGIMIWSLDSDVKGEHSLLSAIHSTLHKSATRPATSDSVHAP